MRLIIGPTSAGKSTYIKRLTEAGDAGGDPVDVHFAFALEPESGIPTGPNDVIHFNLLRGYEGKRVDRVSLERCPKLLDLLDAADEVTVLSAPRSVLLARAADRTHAEPEHDQYGARVYFPHWRRALESPHLAQLCEHLALHLDQAGKPTQYLCSNGDVHDDFQPISRWDYARMAQESAADLCRAGHPEPDLEFGYRTYQPDYRGGAASAMRSATLSRALRMPIAGRRVLDIGCAEGAAALSAARMGARVTALEPRAKRLKAARTIAEALQAEIDFREVILDDFHARPNSFHVVMALNVVHHVPNPFAFLDRAAELTSSHLVVEYPGLDDLKFGATVEDLPSHLDQQPVLGVSLPDQDQTYVFSPASLERYLIDLTGVFGAHEVVPSPIPNRWLSIFSQKQRSPARPASPQEAMLAARLDARTAELKELRRRVRRMESSRAWRATAPLRRVFGPGRSRGGTGAGGGAPG